MIFTRSNGTFYAFVDRFGVGVKLRELDNPKMTDSPAAILNAAEKTDEYVDVPDHIASELNSVETE